MHRTLERYGGRALYSVYEILATARQLDAAVQACADHVDGGGHLLALPFCPACRVVTYGQTRERMPGNLWAAW